MEDPPLPGKSIPRSPNIGAQGQSGQAGAVDGLSPRQSERCDRAEAQVLRLALGSNTPGPDATRSEPPLALSTMFGTSGVLFGSVVVWGAAAIWAAGTLTLLISSFAPTEHEGPTRLPAWDGPPPRVSGPYRTASGTGPHNADGPVGPPGASSRRSGLPRPHRQLGSMDRPRPLVRSLHAHLDQRPHLDRRHGASPPGTRPLHWLPFRSPRLW